MQTDRFSEKLADNKSTFCLLCSAPSGARGGLPACRGPPCLDTACQWSKVVAGGVLLRVRPDALKVWRTSISSFPLDDMAILVGLDLMVRPRGLGRVRGMILGVVHTFPLQWYGNTSTSHPIRQDGRCAPTTSYRRCLRTQLSQSYNRGMQDKKHLHGFDSSTSKEKLQELLDTNTMRCAPSWHTFNGNLGNPQEGTPSR